MSPLLRWTLASLHLVALGIGFGACWLRATRLQKLAKKQGPVEDVFVADNWYGIATVIWIGTGLWRTFSLVEKGSDYYLNNTAFLLKMTLFVLVFALEWFPMISFIRWRMQLKKGMTINTGKAALYAKLSYAELLLLLMMVLAATAMARGFGI
jgi:putative membrane protein